MWGTTAEDINKLNDFPTDRAAGVTPHSQEVA